jgi:hypothetical protein
MFKLSAAPMTVALRKLGVDEKTLQRLVEAGEIRVRSGRKGARYDVAAYLEAQERAKEQPRQGRPSGPLGGGCIGGTPSPGHKPASPLDPRLVGPSRQAPTRPLGRPQIFRPLCSPQTLFGRWRHAFGVPRAIPYASLDFHITCPILSAT